MVRRYRTSMKTTLVLDDALVERVRERAKERGVSMSSIVEEAIVRMLAQPAVPALRSDRPPVVPDGSLPRGHRRPRCALRRAGRPRGDGAVPGRAVIGVDTNVLAYAVNSQCRSMCRAGRCFRGAGAGGPHGSPSRCPGRSSTSSCGSSPTPGSPCGRSRRARRGASSRALPRAARHRPRSRPRPRCGGRADAQRPRGARQPRPRRAHRRGPRRARGAPDLHPRPGLPPVPRPRGRRPAGVLEARPPAAVPSMQASWRAGSTPQAPAGVGGAARQRGQWNVADTAAWSLQRSA